MEFSDILIGLLLTAICIVPVVLIGLNGNKRQKELLSAVKTEALNAIPPMFRTVIGQS